MKRAPTLRTASPSSSSPRDGGGIGVGRDALNSTAVLVNTGPIAGGGEGGNTPRSPKRVRFENVDAEERFAPVRNFFSSFSFFFFSFDLFACLCVLETSWGKGF